MSFQHASIPDGAIKTGSTTSMTQDTVKPGILRRHRTPDGKYGLLVVEEGALRFVWEDDAAHPLDADPAHPIVIEPNRLHHVVLDGPVRFRVEFYAVSSPIEP